MGARGDSKDASSEGGSKATSRMGSKAPSAMGSRAGSKAPAGSKAANEAPVEDEERSSSKAANLDVLRCEKDRCHDSCELLRFTCGTAGQAPEDDNEEELQFEAGLTMSRRRAYFALVCWVTVEVEEDEGGSDLDS